MAFQNFFAAKLFNDAGSADTTITLDTAPTATSGRMVLEARNPTQREIISYSGVSGNQLTGVVRGIAPTSAKPHLKNSLIEMNVTAQDLQDLYDGFNTFSATNGSGWYSIPQVPTITASNGQKEHQLTYSGVNLTSTLQAGTKLRIPRTGVTPTQSMAFSAASSQYATKVAPNGLTFTSTFTCEAWVYLNSYTGTPETIIGRRTSTNGFYFDTTAVGQIELGYVSSSAFTVVNTYQSIPLKQWVHVAGVVSSVSSKALSIYINGVSVPITYSSSSSTALTQAGSLTIGAFDPGANGYMDGYISEARVWSTAQTQTQIQNNMGLSLVGTETGLVALFQGNGNFNDKTANANNLTPTGGAIATQAANPFSTVEHAVVTGTPAFTGGNTVVTVFSGPYVIPNATVSATSYSIARAPYGFDANRGKWSVTIVDMNSTSNTFTANNYINLDNMNLPVPTGAWQLSYKVSLFGDLPSAAIIYSNLSYTQASNVIISTALTSVTYTQSGGGLIGFHGGSDNIALTTQTKVYLNAGSSATGTGLKAYTYGPAGGGVVMAECAYI